MAGISGGPLGLSSRAASGFSAVGCWKSSPIREHVGLAEGREKGTRREGRKEGRIGEHFNTKSGHMLS